MSNQKNQPGDFSDIVAKQYGVSADEVRKEMQAAIDAAWNSPDPAVRAKQRELFPNGKPSIEAFIHRVIRRAKES